MHLTIWIFYCIWLVTVHRAQQTEAPIMLPQVTDEGYPLHKVYQIIIEKAWAWSKVGSCLGSTTLKTESKTHFQSGFSIYIISGIWSEWMLPFFFTPYEIFSQLCYMARAIFISINWYMDFYSASPLKPAVFGLTQPELEPIIYNTRDEEAY